jgi:hypothetical protein
MSATEPEARPTTSSTTKKAAVSPNVMANGTVKRPDADTDPCEWPPCPPGSRLGVDPAADPGDDSCG